MENVLTYAPLAPLQGYAPQHVGPDTWMIRQVQGATGAPLSVYINSLVICGSEPVIVDTGSLANRINWIADVFGIVDPIDVRWVFISHEDPDHVGNLMEVMERCPNAVLVCTWAMVERFTNAFNFPLARCRWVNSGESFDAGDRVLRVVRPPLYDSPTTNGLLDEKTGIYWAVDAFATPMPEPVASVADLDREMWRDSNAMFIHHGLCPWISIVDRNLYGRQVEELKCLDLNTIAGAHNPLIGSADLDQAFRLMRDMPDATVHPAPDQAVLNAILESV